MGRRAKGCWNAIALGVKLKGQLPRGSNDLERVQEPMLHSGRVRAPEPLAVHGARVHRNLVHAELHEAPLEGLGCAGGSGACGREGARLRLQPEVRQHLAQPLLHIRRQLGEAAYTGNHRHTGKPSQVGVKARAGSEGSRDGVRGRGKRTEEGGVERADRKEGQGGAASSCATHGGRREASAAAAGRGTQGREAEAAVPGGDEVVTIEAQPGMHELVCQDLPSQQPEIQHSTEYSAVSLDNKATRCKTPPPAA